MKTRIAISILILCIVRSSQAQTAPEETLKIYQAWVRTYDPPRMQRGDLYEVQDSSVTLSKPTDYLNEPPEKVDISKLDIRTVDFIKVRKQGNVGKGILFGAVSGLVVGGILGILISSPPKSNGTSNSVSKAIGSSISRSAATVTALGTMMGITLTGIGIGAAIGSAKITIPIYGSMEWFDRKKPALEEYSIRHNLEPENKTFSELRDTLVDRDGNVYHLLALGGQVWMAGNLAVTHYRDGTNIHGISGKSPGNGTRYGWSEVNDNRKLCPSGWHIPSMSEWISLYNSLGGQNGAVRKLEKSFSSTGKVCTWWLSSEDDAGQGQSLYLNPETNTFIFTGTSKGSALPVRCLRD